MATVLLSVKQYIPDVTQYFKPDDRPIPQTASFKVVMFKGKTQYHWVGETALGGLSKHLRSRPPRLIPSVPVSAQTDRIPKRTTVAELRMLLAERDLDSCRAFYATLK
jgi:hypothetical protein